MQNKYLKNKIIKTDKSATINLTKLAIIIVQITSVMDKVIPTGIFKFLLYISIRIT
tara:strand:+ start:836 stop:1003 length:168 start_codon:yes stop_codon:yes gene_type:complete